MNKTTKMVGWAILGSALCAPAALGQDLLSYSGALCRPMSTTDTGKVGYGQFGIHNESSSTANVQCGTVFAFQQTINSMGVTVYDRNSSADVCCTFILQNADGLPVWTSGARCSSGNDPGWKAISVFTGGPAATFGTIQCSVPPATASGMSHVTRYFLHDL